MMTISRRFSQSLKKAGKKSEIEQLYSRQKVLNKYNISALLVTDPFVKLLRRELKKLAAGLQIDEVDVATMLVHEVLKQDTVEGEKAEQAAKLIKKALRKANKSKQSVNVANSNETNDTSVEIAQ